MNEGIFNFGFLIGDLVSACRYARCGQNISQSERLGAHLKFVSSHRPSFNLMPKDSPSAGNRKSPIQNRKCPAMGVVSFKCCGDSNYP